MGNNNEVIDKIRKLIKKKEKAFEKCSMESNPERLEHLYRGMDKIKYHKFFDALFNIINDSQILKINAISDEQNVPTDVIETQGSTQSYNKFMPTSNIQVKKYRYTLRRDNIYYKTFKFIKAFSCIYTCHQYPYMAAVGFFGF